MPLLTIWCGLVPDNLEATSITLFTGLLNLSNNLAFYFGSLIIWIFQVKSQNYSNIWIPMVIQNVYLFIMIVLIIFVEFPDLEEKKKDDKAIEILDF